MRYRLRTLLIVSAVAPPLLAGVWWVSAWPGSESAAAFAAICIAAAGLPAVIIATFVKSAWPD